MIKKDKLNMDSSTTNKSKKYRKAETVDKFEVENYFSKKGYNVVDIQKLWRHLYGKLEKDNKIFFLKMASTPNIGERTKNEVSWNQQIKRLVKEFGIDCFDVPDIYNTGEFEGKFYFLSSYHEGSMLASKNPPKTKGLGRWLDKIVKANLFFLSLRNVKFSRDKGAKTIVEKWDEYIQKIQDWYKEARRKQLQKILETVKELKDTYVPGVNHGDFVPWHMIREGEKFILIDGEHASGQSPRYYDICYFYHRLYTSAKNPELAKLYLNKIRKSLSKAEKNKFDSSIRPILASRIIGGFWDAKNDGQVDLTYHTSLKDDFLKNDLF